MNRRKRYSLEHFQINKLPRMTAFLSGCYCFSLFSLCRYNTSFSRSRNWVCPSEKSKNWPAGWRERKVHSICKQAEYFKLPLASDLFCQVLGGILELKKNLGPEMEKCHGLTPAGNEAPSNCSLIPHNRMRGEEIWIRRVKVRMGFNKDSLIDKGKAIHTRRAKQRIHSPLPMVRQVFSHFQESRAPSCVMITWEDKYHNP